MFDYTTICNFFGYLTNKQTEDQCSMWRKMKNFFPNNYQEKLDVFVFNNNVEHGSWIELHKIETKFYVSYCINKNTVYDQPIYLISN